MKPHLHAISSAKKHGGKMEDYMDIHDFMDSTKAALPDVRHRAILHNSFGCFIVEKVFGTVRHNSDGKMYSTRDIAEQHIMEDLGGHIPTIEEWLRDVKIAPWMGPTKKEKKFIPFEAPLSEEMPFGYTLKEKTINLDSVWYWVNKDGLVSKNFDSKEDAIKSVNEHYAEDLKLKSKSDNLPSGYRIISEYLDDGTYRYKWKHEESGTYAPLWVETRKAAIESAGNNYYNRSR